MLYLILIGIILVVGGFATLASFAGKGTPASLRFVPSVLMLLALTLVTAFFSFTRIDQREVGIVTSFGKYDSTLTEGGVHWLKPWSDVERFDQTLQTATVKDVSASFTDGGGAGLAEIGGGKGVIDATVRWQISKNQSNGGAKLLWEKYRTFEAVNDSLITRSARDTVINIANDYPASTAIISQDDMANKIKESLTTQLAPYGIVVDSVSIPAIDLDPGTQSAVDKLFTTQQDIKRAQNEQKRAQIDAETVRIRQAEGALSPEANQRYCLDLVNSWDVKKNGPLPATFDCSLNGSTQDSVIVTQPQPSSDK